MTVMPCGLVDSQATFQRMMDNTLKGLNRVESYIDDCVIYSHSFEEHLKDLQEVLERLRRANIHIKFRKCQLCYPEVEFLGHLISECYLVSRIGIGILLWMLTLTLVEWLPCCLRGTNPTDSSARLTTSHYH